MEFLCETGCSLLDLEETRFIKAYEKVKSINPVLANWLWDKRGINYERFWEIALAGLKKNVKWSNVEGMDHSDGTEVKTLRYSWDKTNESWCGQVGNTDTKTGNMKIVIYNPNDNEFFCVFLTNKQKESFSNCGGKGQLKFTFPRYRKPTGWWVNYVVPFEKFIKL